MIRITLLAKLALTLFCLCCSRTANAMVQELDRSWTLVRQDLEIMLEPESGMIQVEGKLLARLEHADESEDIVLALNTREPIMSFDEVRSRAASVRINQTHEQLPSALLSLVRFKEPKQRGDLVEVSFVYHSEGKGRQFVVEGSAALASWVEGWYPILPPAEGVSFGGASKVKGSTSFRMPEGWHALTNGGLVSSEVIDGERVERWHSEHALSRSFVAGPYTILHERLGALDVSLYLLSNDLPMPQKHVESLTRAIAAMEERWGAYPYPSYAIAEVPLSHGSFGASSEQGFIMVKPFFLRTKEGNLPLFAHEASHAWWGNTVGSDGPGALLCSESLAQYGAVIAAERVWGLEIMTEFLRFSRPGYMHQQSARGYFELWRQGKDRPLAKLVSGGDIDHTLADSKGHWIFHMLRRRVGDEVFFATLRKLIAEFAGRSLTLEELRAQFTRAAPAASLPRFFRQWLDGMGAPVLLPNWKATGDGIELTIQQLQPGEPFELLLDVALFIHETEVGTQQIRLNRREQSFQLETRGEVTELVLDPRHELLLWNPEYGESPVAGMEGLRTKPLPKHMFPRYAGDYELAPRGQKLKLFEDDGRLMLILGNAAAQPLVHTGEHRFRSVNGFLIFSVLDDQAKGLTFMADSGGTREALRMN